MTVNIVINCNDSLIIQIAFLKDNWICSRLEKQPTPKAITVRMRCFKEPNHTNGDHYFYPFVPTPWNMSLLQINNKALLFFIIFTTPKRWRWQFENSCLGVPLHTVALCYCYLMSSITLSFGRRWGEYRTPWLNQFHLIPRHYRRYLFTYRWVCVVPW